jgi:hypothetical protein
MLGSDAMKIQCECGAFSATLNAFPKATPGRLVCYCDDCQSYLHHLGRADLLDANGGTEVIPAYPAGRGISKRTRTTQVPAAVAQWYIAILRCLL